MVEMGPGSVITRGNGHLHYGALVNLQRSAVYHRAVRATLTLCGRSIDGLGPHARWHDFDAGWALIDKGLRPCAGCDALERIA